VKHYTLCTLCNREIRAVQSWTRWQAGQSVEWRASRHRATEQKAGTGLRETICPGSGFQIPAEAVLPEQVTA
jgi:hypothetical protein